MVVQIAVDGRAGQSAEHRFDADVELVADAGDRARQGVVVDGVRASFDDAAGIGEIPVEIAVNGRMIEFSERVAELGDPPAEIRIE